MDRDHRLLISKILAALRVRDGQTDRELTISVYGSYTQGNRSAINGECNYQARGCLLELKKVQAVYRNYISARIPKKEQGGELCREN